jgi:hypothetical protein
VLKALITGPSLNMSAASPSRVPRPHAQHAWFPILGGTFRVLELRQTRCVHAHREYTAPKSSLFGCRGCYPC